MEDKIGIRSLKVEKPDGSSKSFIFAVDEKGYSKNMFSVAEVAFEANRLFGAGFVVSITPIVITKKKLPEEDEVFVNTIPPPSDEPSVGINKNWFLENTIHLEK